MSSLLHGIKWEAFDKAMKKINLHVNINISTCNKHIMNPIICTIYVHIDINLSSLIIKKHFELRHRKLCNRCLIVLKFA